MFEFSKFPCTYQNTVSQSSWRLPLDECFNMREETLKPGFQHLSHSKLEEFTEIKLYFKIIFISEIHLSPEGSTDCRVVTFKLSVCMDVENP